MKIAFVNHTFIMGSGIDSLIYQLSRRLVLRNEVKVFTFCSDYPSGLSFPVHEERIPYKRNRVIRQLFAPFFLSAWGDMRRKLADYDVIISQIYPGNLTASVPSRLNKPLNIVIEWSTPRQPYSRPLEKLYVGIISDLNRFACAKADRVLVSSNFVQNLVLKHWDVRAEKMLLDGVDFNLFCREKASAERVYSLYPSLRGKLVILYVGQIAPHKNLAMLIEALSIIRDKVRDAVLMVVGSKSYRNYYEELLKLVEDRGLCEAVIFTDVIPWDDLPDYYAACDLYATCSVWEGFLRGEAYALAKPMVAYDVTAHSESIIHGKTGLLVKEITAEAFADAVASLLGDTVKLKRTGENGFNWARENLDMDIIAVRLENYLAALLKEKAGRDGS